MKLFRRMLLFGAISFAHIVYAQTIDIEKVEIDFKYDEYIEIDRFSKKCDTLNYYLFLGSEFLNDTFLVIQNDSVIFYNSVQTDHVLGASELIKIKDYNYGVKMKINNMPNIELPIIKGKYYILIDFSRLSKTLLVKYSKLLPKLN